MFELPSFNHQPKAKTPVTVTRGESIQAGVGGQKTVIDWLTVTFKKPAFTVQFLISLLSDYCTVSLRGVDKAKGMRGFETCVQLEACINDEFKQIGFVAFGGDAQRGRWMLDIQGGGCGLIRDWEALQDFLEGLEDVRLTRVDLAADFLNGEKTVEDAVELWKEGAFTMNGRPPETSTTGDWLAGERGRTLYVGKRQNGKMLCVYEKGKQLGDLQSEWTRYELRLGNKDREIPLDILTNQDKYFAGAYPALQALLEQVEGERIKTISKEGEISLVQLLYHAKRCYGKLFDVVKNVNGYSLDGLIDSVTVKGLPRRLDAQCMDAQIHWSDLKEQLDRLEVH